MLSPSCNPLLPIITGICYIGAFKKFSVCVSACANVCSQKPARCHVERNLNLWLQTTRSGTAKDLIPSRGFYLENDHTMGRLSTSFLMRVFCCSLVRVLLGPTCRNRDFCLFFFYLPLLKKEVELNVCFPFFLEMCDVVKPTQLCVANC